MVLGRDAFAQPPQSAIDRCNVVTGSTEVNAEGELVRPPPTQQDCAAAEALVDKFLATARGDFRRVDIIEDVPGNVSVYVGRITPWGGSVNELPVNRPHGVTWLSDRIVVVVIETSDFAGPTTTVVIADLEAHQVCEFERWPGAEDPRNLTVQEIQDVLDDGLLGAQDTVTCRISPLPID